MTCIDRLTDTENGVTTTVSTTSHNANGDDDARTINTYAVGRKNVLVTGGFAVLTFLVLFSVDPVKLKDALSSQASKKAPLLSWDNLRIETRGKWMTQIQDATATSTTSNKMMNGDDATLGDRIPRQSVLMNVRQEHLNNRSAVQQENDSAPGARAAP